MTPENLGELETKEFELGELVHVVKLSPLLGNTIAPPLRDLGREFAIIGIYICKCGQHHINVGLNSEYNYISCYLCKVALPSETIHWCHPSRFRRNF